MQSSRRLVRTALVSGAMVLGLSAVPFVAAALDGPPPPPAPAADDGTSARGEPVLILDAKTQQPVETTFEELDRLRAEGEARFGTDQQLWFYGGEYVPNPDAPELVCEETATEQVCGETRELVDATIEAARARPGG